MTIPQDFAGNAGDEAWITNFFTQNIVMVAYTLGSNTKGVHQMGAYNGWTTGGYDLQYQGRSGAGGTIPIVTLANEPGLLDTFPAYWCPFEQNNAPHAHLKTAASYMFTAKMDGCSFGIGIPAGNGSVYVAHANQGGDGHAQLAQLKGHAKFPGGVPQATFGPGSYRFRLDTVSSMATTFGLLVGTQWKFYSQVILVDINQKILTHYGLVPIG